MQQARTSPSSDARWQTMVRRVSTVIAIGLLPVFAASCSSDSDSSAPNSTSAPAAGVVETTSVGQTDAPAETDAPVETAGTTAEEPAGSTDATSDDGCSTVPSKEVVESIIGSTVLPVEDQGSVGCAYLGDGDNVGVYFEIETDPFELEQFDAPDPAFATPVEDPGLPPGSFVQSGDFYAKQDGVLYKVTAAVTGTEDDDPLATQLMIAWLALLQ